MGIDVSTIRRQLRDSGGSYKPHHGDVIDQRRYSYIFLFEKSGKEGVEIAANRIGFDTDRQHE